MHIPWAPSDLRDTVANCVPRESPNFGWLAGRILLIYKIALLPITTVGVC